MFKLCSLFNLEKALCLGRYAPIENVTTFSALDITGAENVINFN